MEKQKYERAYRFLFDNQSGEFRGVTRVTPFPENSTLTEPYFDAGFKTVFDRVSGNWKLVPREMFYDQMSRRDDIEETIDIKNFILTEKLREMHNSLTMSYAFINERLKDFEEHSSLHRKEIILALSEQAKVNQDNFNLIYARVDNHFVLNEIRLCRNDIDRARIEIVNLQTMIHPVSNFFLICRARLERLFRALKFWSRN